MRVLVCGSRTWTDVDPIDWAISGLYRSYGDELELIEGGGRGADDIAMRTATRLGLPRFTYAADWKTHGNAAGPIRNKQMLEEGEPDIVLAFVDKPLEQSRGTADMVRRAEAAGVPVYVIEKREANDGQ